MEFAKLSHLRNWPFMTGVELLEFEHSAVVHLDFLVGKGHSQTIGSWVPVQVHPSPFGLVEHMDFPSSVSVVKSNSLVIRNSGN